MSEAVTILMSVILVGRIDGDFLISCLVASLVVASFVLAVLMNLQNRIIRREIARTRELTRAKERAERALRAERETMTEQIRLADMLAHEYRTPLSTIRGNLDILHTIGGGSSVVDKAVTRMRGAADRLTDIIEVGLRSGGGPLGLRPRPGDLLATLAEAVAAALDGHPGRHVTFDAEDGRIIVTHDERLLAIAIANVVDNALKYSPPATEVGIFVRKNDGQVVLILTSIDQNSCAH